MRNVNEIRDTFPVGTYIVLDQMDDDPHPIASGTKGVVEFVDDIGTVHCEFENGRLLGLVVGVDAFHIDLLRNVAAYIHYDFANCYYENMYEISEGKTNEPIYIGLQQPEEAGHAVLYIHYPDGSSDFEYCDNTEIDIYRTLQEIAGSNATAVLPTNTMFWNSIASNEFDFITSFAKTITDPDFSFVDMQQLRALWSAYCIHQDMEVDTATYDKELSCLWHVLNEKFPKLVLEQFGNFMAEHLV